MSQAARVNDRVTCLSEIALGSSIAQGPILPPGSVNVFIEGMPAARMGDLCQCGPRTDSITIGSATVFINGMPAARLNDPTSGGVIISAATTVFIGG